MKEIEKRYKYIKGVLSSKAHNNRKLQKGKGVVGWEVGFCGEAHFAAQVGIICF